VCDKQYYHSLILCLTTRTDTAQKYRDIPHGIQYTVVKDKSADIVNINNYNYTGITLTYVLSSI